MDSPTHKVDCHKNRVALEIEWNSKDPFFDRDVNNFRPLFDLHAIYVGGDTAQKTQIGYGWQRFQASVARQVSQSFSG